MATDFIFQERTVPLKLTFDGIRGEGRVAPRLVLAFACRPTREQIRIDVERLSGEIWLEAEMLGVGTMRDMSLPVFHSGTNVHVSVPIDRAVVAYVDERFRDDTLNLRLDLRTRTRWRTEPPGQGDEWIDGSGYSQGSIAVSRAEWARNVVAPLGIDDLVVMELWIPPPPERSRWTESLRHIDEAEGLYREGNDAEVLQRCYAAFEALEGAPQDVFAREPDPAKRDRLDAALKSAKMFMHAGRHISTAAGAKGGFAVDHRDAAFALAQAKVWLSYIAKLLRTNS